MAKAGVDVTTDATFTILAVCSGNIARSPIIAAMLAARLDDPAIEVSSAGTVASPGEPMTDEALAVAARYGLTGTDHRSRALTPELIADADLVLVATREHRADVARLEPIASRRTFTLREFVRLLRTVDDDVLQALPVDYPERGIELVRAVAARRGSVPPLQRASDDDVDDPFLRPAAVYDRVGSEIDEAVGTLVLMMVAPDDARAE